MQREIKFRAWDKTRHEYLSGGQILIAVLKGNQPEHNPIYLDILKDADFYKNRFVLEQYTGLKDGRHADGKEIYEGDICKDDKGDIVVIEWNNEKSMFSCRIVKGGVLTKGLLFPLWQWNDCQMNGFRYLEVVENIHENPELLEVSE